MPPLSIDLSLHPAHLAVREAITKALRLIFLAVVFTLFCEGQAASATKLRLSQSNVGLTSAPLWFAISHGFFKKYGLEVEPVYVRNSTIQMMALTSSANESEPFRG